MKKQILIIGILVLITPHSKGQQIESRAISNDMLIPKTYLNSCIIDPAYRNNLDSLLGTVVIIGKAGNNDTLVTMAQIQSLVSYRKDDAKANKITNPEINFRSVLKRKEIIGASFLSFLFGRMEKNDIAEVKVSRLLSLSLENKDLDLGKIKSTTSKVSSDNVKQFGVITALDYYTIYQTIYTSRETNVGGAYFGVRLDGDWYYNNGFERTDHYIIATYAPMAYLNVLAALDTIGEVELENARKTKDLYSTSTTGELDSRLKTEIEKTPVSKEFNQKAFKVLDFRTLNSID